MPAKNKTARLEISAGGDTTLTTIVAINIAAALAQHGVTVHFEQDGKKVRNVPIPQEVYLKDLTVTIATKG